MRFRLLALLGLLASAEAAIDDRAAQAAPLPPRPAVLDRVDDAADPSPADRVEAALAQEPAAGRVVRVELLPGQTVTFAGNAGVLIAVTPALVALHSCRGTERLALAAASSTWHRSDGRIAVTNLGDAPFIAVNVRIDQAGDT